MRSAQRTTIIRPNSSMADQIETHFHSKPYLNNAHDNPALHTNSNPFSNRNLLNNAKNKNHNHHQNQFDALDNNDFSNSLNDDDDEIIESFNLNIKVS